MKHGWLRGELLQIGDAIIDLADGARFDWQDYVQSLSDEASKTYFAVTSSA